MVGQVIHIAKRTGGQRIAAHFAAAAILAAVSGDRAAFAQCNYEVTAILDIGDCDIGDSHTFGQGMNNNADVVGYYRFCAVGNERAFFWSQDTGFITLPHPPGVVRSWAYDISDTRIIVGQHEFSGIGRKGFAYDMATGEYRHLEPLHDGVSAVNVSSANAVNNSGVVAGMRIIAKPGDPQPLPYNAVIWRPWEKGSPVEDLGVMEGPNSAGRGINEPDQAVGWTGQSITSNPLGFSSTFADVIILGPIPGGTTSRCSEVDQAGYVLGSGHVPGKSGTTIHAFVWREKWIEILAPPSGFDHIGGGDLNDLGQRILTATVAGGADRSFLWQHGNVHNLMDLLVPGEDVLLNSAQAVNNRGQMLIRAGTKGAFLTPINVPLADLNYDCNVDAHDLQILLKQWGAVQRSGSGARGPNGVPSADLNGDGVVDGADLLILLANWSP